MTGQCDEGCAVGWTGYLCNKGIWNLAYTRCIEKFAIWINFCKNWNIQTSTILEMYKVLLAEREHVCFNNHVPLFDALLHFAFLYLKKNSAKIADYVL